MFDVRREIHEQRELVTKTNELINLLATLKKWCEFIFNTYWWIRGTGFNYEKTFKTI
jgi:hypothetical protein